MIRLLSRISLPIPPVDKYLQEMHRALSQAFDQITQQLNSQVQGAGNNLVSAGSIAPSHAIHRVTGSATIQTIYVPDGFTGPVCLVKPAGASWQTGTAGNIASAVNPAVGTALYLVFDGTIWYPTRSA